MKLPYDDAVERALNVATLTSQNTSSMLSDVLRGVTTEVDAINGAIVREGDRLGVSVDCNRILWNLVKTKTHLSADELYSKLQL